VPGQHCQPAHPSSRESVACKESCQLANPDARHDHSAVPAADDAGRYFARIAAHWLHSVETVCRSSGSGPLLTTIRSLIEQIDGQLREAARLRNYANDRSRANDLWPDRRKTPRIPKSAEPDQWMSYRFLHCSATEWKPTLGTTSNGL
jgi:hypothetical protein